MKEKGVGLEVEGSRHGLGMGISRGGGPAARARELAMQGKETLR